MSLVSQKMSSRSKPPPPSGPSPPTSPTLTHADASFGGRLLALVMGYCKMFFRFLTIVASLGVIVIFAVETSSSLSSTATQQLHAVASRQPRSVGDDSASSNAAGGYVCKISEIFAQAHWFLRGVPPGEPRWKEVATGCPPRELFWPGLVAKGLSCRGVTIVNVGANKGYLIASLLDLVRPDLGITPKSLFAFFKTPEVATKQLVHDGCGFCDDCLEGHLPAFESAHRLCFDDATGKEISRESFDVTLHAFEPTSSNSELLEYGVFRLINASSSASKERFKASLHRYAVVGDPTLTSVSFGDCKAGVERCGVADSTMGFSGATKEDRDIGTIEVPATTLDVWAAEEGVHMIDLLAVDTEGMDPEVLKGATGLLESHQIRILEFEYHMHRAWQATSLEAVVAKLDGYGFDCFFENMASLTRLTGCWHSSFEVRGWSNVVCSLRSEHAVLALLNSLTVGVGKR